jgi:hypothetical protein
MNDPIPISKEGSDENPLLTAEEIIALDTARHNRRVQWAFLTVLGIAALALIIPMGVWLTRLALGQ